MDESRGREVISRAQSAPKGGETVQIVHVGATCHLILIFDCEKP